MALNASTVRATMTGEVVSVRSGTTSKGTPYVDVTMMQAPEPGSKGQVHLVDVRCWNGQVKQLAVGSTGKLDVVIRLQRGVDATGKPYPPRMTVDAF